MKYIEFNIRNPRCIHCFMSDRAAATVYSEVYANGRNETGGVFIGYIINRTWYVVEAIDAGLKTVNNEIHFEWDRNYVNHLIQKLRPIYKIPLTVLGFWHRHPGDMNYFSGMDESTIMENLKNMKLGLISMLVNIDPKLRMTFYYCYGNEIMKIRYDIGDHFFPQDFLKFTSSADMEERAKRDGREFKIHYQPVFKAEDFAGSKTENNDL